MCLVNSRPACPPDILGRFCADMRCPKHPELLLATQRIAWLVHPQQADQLGQVFLSGVIHYRLLRSCDLGLQHRAAWQQLDCCGSSAGWVGATPSAHVMRFYARSLLD